MLTELAWHAVGCSSTCGALVAVMLTNALPPHRLVWLAGWIAPAWACIWVLNLHPASSSAVTFFSGFPPRGLQSAARMLITLIHLGGAALR